jgi:hypothetical protein
MGVGRSRISRLKNGECHKMYFVGDGGLDQGVVLRGTEKAREGFVNSTESKRSIPCYQRPHSAEMTAPDVTYLTIICQRGRR